ncbi:MAG: PKD domain-containing protein, partial [Bacteroidetes bacterium]|nr:PKD domain-containing protein [Bacteroidota bacterium]
MKKLLPVLIISFLVSACGKEPVADFSISHEKPAAGEKLFFYNTSSNAVDFEWDFGDGTTSTEESPEKIFKNAGNFNVTLKAFSENGKKTGTVSKSIMINGFEGSYLE